jgi:hypothetical protein
MNDFYKMLITTGIIILCGAIAMVCFSVRNGIVGNAFDSQLQSRNITVIKGYIDSPSVRIPVDKTQFMQEAEKVGVVYQCYDSSFYVFTNKEQTIALQYDIPII